MSAAASTEPRFSGNARLVHGVAVALLLKVCVIFGPVLGIALAGSEEAMFAGGPITWVIFSILAGSQAAIVLLALDRLGRISLVELGWRGGELPRDLARGALGFLGCAAVIFGSVLLSGDEPSSFFEYLSQRTWVEQLLFIGIGGIAAFGEESVFRGYLQPAFMRRFGKALGLGLVALIFAVLHFKFRPLALMGKLAIGLVLGALRGEDRPLWGPALAHAAMWAVFGLY